MKVPNHSALILFADVIDSSMYSSILGIVGYAENLLKFQKLFKTIGTEYFKAEGRGSYWSTVDAKGDEGVIMFLSPEIKPDDIVNKAVQFSFELKARMELVFKKAGIEDESPKKMKLGIGIHYGQVAIVNTKGEVKGSSGIDDISHVEGYSINYAKRIESCSRLGKFSHIFLSKEATSLLQGDPIVFEKHYADLKGLAVQEEVHEIRSAFFEELPLNLKSIDTEAFVNTYGTYADQLDLVREPWLKGLVVSVLHNLISKSMTGSMQEAYRRKLSSFIWQKMYEDDPIILYFRAWECGREGKHTQRLNYLKKIVESYPYFVQARIQLAQACWEISRSSTDRAEKIIARDIADELLSKFPGSLTREEKECFDAMREINYKTTD